MKRKGSIILTGLILIGGGLFFIKPWTASRDLSHVTSREEPIRTIATVLPGTPGPLVTLVWEGEEWLTLIMTDETGRKEFFRTNRNESPGLLPPPLFYGSPGENNRGPYRLELSRDVLNRLERFMLYYRRSPIRQYLILYNNSPCGSGEPKSLRVLDGQGRYLYSLDTDLP